MFLDVLIIAGFIYFVLGKLKCPAMANYGVVAMVVVCLAAYRVGKMEETVGLSQEISRYDWTNLNGDNTGEALLTENELSLILFIKDHLYLFKPIWFPLYIDFTDHRRKTNPGYAEKMLDEGYRKNCLKSRVSIANKYYDDCLMLFNRRLDEITRSPEFQFSEPRTFASNEEYIELGKLAIKFAKEYLELGLDNEIVNKNILDVASRLDILRYGLSSTDRDLFNQLLNTLCLNHLKNDVCPMIEVKYFYASETSYQLKLSIPVLLEIDDPHTLHGNPPGIDKNYQRSFLFLIEDFSYTPLMFSPLSISASDQENIKSNFPILHEYITYLSRKLFYDPRYDHFPIELNVFYAQLFCDHIGNIENRPPYCEVLRYYLTKIENPETWSERYHELKKIYCAEGTRYFMNLERRGRETDPILIKDFKLACEDVSIES